MRWFLVTATTNTQDYWDFRILNNFYDNAGCNLTIEGAFMPRIFCAPWVLERMVAPTWMIAGLSPPVLRAQVFTNKHA